jgi:hypothetical protein
MERSVLQGYETLSETKKTLAIDGPVSLTLWMKKERLTEKTSRTE